MLNLCFTSVSAPFSYSCWDICRWPSLHARWKGVQPFFVWHSTLAILVKEHSHTNVMYWCFLNSLGDLAKHRLLKGSMFSLSSPLKGKCVCQGKFNIATLNKEKNMLTCSVTKTQVQHDLFPQLTSRGFPWNQKQKESILTKSTWGVRTVYFSKAGFRQTAGYKTTNWSLLWLIISATHEPKQGRNPQLSLCYQHKKGMGG